MAERHEHVDMTGQVAAPPVAPARPRRLSWVTVSAWADQQAGAVMLLPAVLIILLLAIFPLIFSLYLSLSRFQLVSGGFRIQFVGLLNYQKLFFGVEHEHFLGTFAPSTPLSWVILGIGAIILIGWLLRYARSRPPQLILGLLGRGIVAAGILAALWLLEATLRSGGRPGTLIVTLIYVVVGVALQYVVGLGLALLCTQQIPGRRFFRVVFLLPMMITPVGIAYMFRMLTDTTKGPLAPLWEFLGLANFSWVNDPWGARIAVMIGDLWQWTPFMFIVLLAALEGQPQELLEAATVDGANLWQIFWKITLPQIAPVSSTLILIRLIEAFKIFDMPNVLTGGGPGTATESLTLHAYVTWRAFDFGTSAAIAYTLLFIVTFVGLSYVNLIHRRLTEAAG
ncbi:carbohydrate ABC transporter permease [Thermorudis peleae]|uniref:carbohydrate ABC transporter permease n=1 Tax=Thermorudis peleae TaxID=1382356 RepID=UPI000A91C2A2|nr:sugar ABC transporter permease [Thermorudis peleae]